MISVLLRMVTIGLMLSMANAFSANDIASSPINYLISAQVKPNIFFILDDRARTKPYMFVKFLFFKYPSIHL